MTINIKETIDNITEPTKVILSTMTEVKLNKKDKSKEVENTLSTVYKLQKIVVELNVDYEERMNQILVESGEEPNFKSSGLPWGTVIDEKWVQHNDQYYLKVIQAEKIDNPNYVVKNENDELEEISYETIEPFLPASSKKENTDKPKVNFRMFQLSSIINVEPYENPA